MATKPKSKKTNTSKNTEKSYKCDGKVIAKATLFKKSSSGKFTATKNSLKKGAKVTISKKSSKGYYYIEKGPSGNVKLWVKTSTVKPDRTTAQIKNSTKDHIQEQLKKEIKSAESYKTLKKRFQNTKDNLELDKLLVTSLQCVHGVPYQFMHTADNPLDNAIMFGRKYTERIIMNMPLLIMSPGEPDFLPNYSKKQRMSLAQKLVSGSDVSANTINNLLSGKGGRYYTFTFKYGLYYKYVNSMLRYCSVALGISKVKHSIARTGDTGYFTRVKVVNKPPKGASYTKPLGEFKWQKVITANSKWKSFFNSAEYVTFYLDSETSISESFSTSTTTSGLQSTMDSISGTVREFQFLAGPIAGKKINAMDPEGFKSGQAQVKKIVKKYLGKGAANSKFFGNLNEAFQTIGRGGRLAFPEIWEDTEFTKSYDVSMKLRTPDGDKISWFLNICVPLIHILAMAAPRSLDNNSYRSPFLVRAYYKGIFNCDMGIITSLNITKGKDGAWSIDGLPTEVDIQMSLKDLYSLLTITSADDQGLKALFKNTCLLDYLSNTCGININKPELSRMMETYILFTKNKIKDTFGNTWMGLAENITNFESKIWDKIKV